MRIAGPSYEHTLLQSWGTAAYHAIFEPSLETDLVERKAWEALQKYREACRLVEPLAKQLKPLKEKSK